MNNEKKGYIDIFKFLFCICIVAIHTECINKTSSVFDWYIFHGLFRLAVPFFFVCSGYFYARKISKEPNQIRNITKKYIKRISVPFVFWLIVGLIISEYKNNYTNNTVSTIMILFKKIIFYPWGALWYILALIVSIFILSKFYSRKKYVEPIIIGYFLYLFALICNSYYFVIENNNFIKTIINKYMDIFISARNGLFVGLIFVSIGGYIYKLSSENKLFKFKDNILFFVISYLILLIEITIVKNNNYIEDSSLFLIMPIVAFFLVSILSSKNTKRNYLYFRKMSIIIYLIHKPILAVFQNYFYIEFGFKLFLLVLVPSILISLLIIKINNKYVNKIVMI